MYKKIFFMSLTTGIFASVASIVFNKVYFFAFETSYSKLVNYGTLVGLNMAACLLAGFGYWAAKKYFPKKADIIFNITFTLLSFASIFVPLSISLPLDIQNPELFPGLAIPMHFFPVVGWFTLKPIFLKG
jgi:hypothetical protein